MDYMSTRDSNMLDSNGFWTIQIFVNIMALGLLFLFFGHVAPVNILLNGGVLAVGAGVLTKRRVAEHKALAPKPKEIVGTEDKWSNTDYILMTHKTIKDEIEVFGEAKTTCYCGNCKRDAEKAQRQLDYQLKARKSNDYKSSIDSHMSEIKRTYELPQPVVVPPPPKEWWFSRKSEFYNREYFFLMDGRIDVEKAESMELISTTPTGAKIARRWAGANRFDDRYTNKISSTYCKPLGCTCDNDLVAVYSDQSPKPVVNFSYRTGDCDACVASKVCAQTKDCHCDTCIEIAVAANNKKYTRKAQW